MLLIANGLVKSSRVFENRTALATQTKLDFLDVFMQQFKRNIILCMYRNYTERPAHKYGIIIPLLTSFAGSTPCSYRLFLCYFAVAPFAGLNLRGLLLCGVLPAALRLPDRPRNERPRNEQLLIAAAQQTHAHELHSIKHNAQQH